MIQDADVARRRVKRAPLRLGEAIDEMLGPIAAPVDAALLGLSASGLIAIFGEEWALDGGILVGMLAFFWKAGLLRSDVVVTPEERWVSSHYDASRSSDGQAGSTDPRMRGGAVDDTLFPSGTGLVQNTARGAQ